jgi:5-methyltetrahydropteroyltriglutamate--homocysteine methyltransferase
MARNGADLIQIEEPSLVRNPERFDLFKESFNQLRETAGDARILLTFYFGDVGKIFRRLPELPADLFGIDFTYSPGLLSKVATDGFPRAIAFGILDGRNTRMESPNDAARVLEPALKKVKSRECHITTSCGLEFLPRAHAIKKLELTAKIAKLING